MITKADFDVELSSLNISITSNKTKQLLFENELKKLKTFDLGYFIGKSHFDEDGAQNYLVLQSMLEYFTLNSNKLQNRSQKYYLTKVLKLFLHLTTL